MSISSIGGQSQPPSMLAKLAADLQKSGLSSDKASTISSEIDSVVKSAISNSSGKPDRASIREAIDKQIKSDVESGELTQDEADAVTKTLETLDKQTSQRAGGPPPGGPSGWATSRRATSRRIGRR